jgi:hypothetical protein
MKAHSPRLSDIAAKMVGSESAGYKRIQRFLQDNDPREALKTLFNEEAEFVIADPTEIERPHADQTEYVGTLMDGQTKGFWMLNLETPLRGRFSTMTPSRNSACSCWSHPSTNPKSTARSITWEKFV